MSGLQDFWDDHPEIHGMYERPARLFSDSIVAYQGYALYCVLVTACHAGLVDSPWPSYIIATKDVEENKLESTN